MVYKIAFTTKWADFDPNKHLRHTAYNDYAAECRIRFFNDFGLTPALLEANHIGPILFKEETTFYKEIRLGESLHIELRLKAISAQAERFKMHHYIYKDHGVLAAEVQIFAAWLHLEQRKLAVPPPLVKTVFCTLDQTEDFEELLIKSKN
ncbi:MAG: thioesterase [Flavobacteriales bacterium CG03_land_8_20_14_0_80_35_15]|nr:MAG: thioesterase [Flavobacteriales bacterium CG03_land_8_20_14_0_80_35_15]